MLFVLPLNPQFSIDLQLAGGLIILQTLPAVALGLYTRWFHRWALVAGWAAGMVAGRWMFYTVKAVGPDGVTVLREHFGGTAFSLANLGFDTKLSVYAGLLAVLLNLAVAVLGTWLLRALKAPDGDDATRAPDYTADEGDPKVKQLDLDPA